MRFLLLILNVPADPCVVSGYEVSQSNAAFIIRRKLSTAIIDKMIGKNLISPSSSSPIQASHINLADLPEKLLVRQLLLSIQGGNSESAHLLGSHFLHTRPLQNFTAAARQAHEFPLNHLSTLYPTRFQAALYWYSKSSTMGNPFGSLQCGLIHHFGVLNNPSNLQRAERYYQLALEQYNKSESTEGARGLKILCEGMLWLIQYSKRYSLVRSVSDVIGWGLRWFFFEG